MTRSFCRMKILLILAVVCSFVDSQKSSASELLPSKFEIIFPSHLHPSRHRRDLSTLTQDGHLQDTSFSFTGKGKNFLLNIYLNRYLIHKDYFETYQLPDGNIAENKVVEHCYYHGMISGNTNTSVVLSTCDGLRGTIKDHDGKVYGIEPKSGSSLEHIFYDMEDLPKNESKCGVDHENLELHNHFGGHLRVRRASSVLTDKKYISLAMVNDKRQFENYQSNLTLVVRRALEVANHVDELYKTLNARVAVVYVDTWNIMDLAQVTTTASETLGNFGSYNKNVLAKILSKKSIRRDNAQLLTGIRFSGSIVGMAGIGTICGLASNGVNSDYGTAAKSASTVAHELGHNLGMPHDSGGCVCSSGPCVMAAVGGGEAKGFTTCSKAAFENRIKDGLASCLFDVPAKLFGPPVCGNGFIEEGELCDCGTIAECQATNASACCNATTCTLQKDAQCAVGPCCSGCQFKAQGIMCRERQTECDLEEVCTGKSPECPGNFYKQDGTPCRNESAYCFEGGCRTHVEQCALLWGQGTKMGHDLCYSENTEGTKWSNCGQNELKQYLKCDPEDVKCGTIQCTETANRFPIVGTGIAARTLRHYITVNGVSREIVCRQGFTNMGEDLDNPTLVQQGTKCAEGKICMSHKCVNLTSLDFIKICPNDTCYNGGICNNMGNCHCPIGFACPDCKHPGQGGSVNSGNLCYVKPVEPKKGGLSTLTKSMLILFLGVLPIVVITIVLLFKFRARLPCRALPKPSQQHSQPSSSRQPEKNIKEVPQVGFNQPPAQPSAPTLVPNVYSNRTFETDPKALQPVRPPGTPGRAPPPPPSAGKPLTPGKPEAPPPYTKNPTRPTNAAPLPPVRPMNAPAGPAKPGKLPPVVPRKPPPK